MVGRSDQPRHDRALRDAGGIQIEFPIHPIQVTGKRPTAGFERLAYLSLVKVIHGYPIDGIALTIGCDKTTPACLMAAATVNIPAIALSVGPMLNGHYNGQRTGSGTIVSPAALIRAGIHALPCLGDERQSVYPQRLAQGLPRDSL